ncbi:MAG: hypothetical protein LBL13_02590 [Bacteroidales bacterium]|jgi:hypothetical protein|nr:hypothetical protein [Bacteroidales bacterium]
MYEKKVYLCRQIFKRINIDEYMKNERLILENIIDNLSLNKEDKSIFESVFLDTFTLSFWKNTVRYTENIHIWGANI